MNDPTLRQGVVAAGLVAQRFGSMLRRTATVRAPAVLRACAVRITAGQHLGAQARLRDSPVRIGSAVDNDVVLRDDGVAAHHAELRRVDGRWALYAGASPTLLPALELRRQGACVRALHRIGMAEVIVSHCVREPREAVPQPAWQRYLAPGLFVLAAALGAAVIVQFVKPAEAGMPAGVQGLAKEGWPDVRVVVNAAREVRIEGHVDDAPALERLRAWLRMRGLGEAQASVRVGSELAARVREALGDTSLAVAYLPGGTVRVQGSSGNLQLRTQLQRLRSDMAGAATVEDRVVYTEAPEAPKFRPLPFRIVNVVPGENGSFTSDTGGRYFVGAVLPDGAEVLAIHVDGVMFRIGEKSVIYPLK